MTDTFKPIGFDKFTSQELDILERNKKFYLSSKKYIDEFFTIIDGKSPISIRVVDWFVANYSKKNNTSYRIKINGQDKYFYAYNEYKNQLNGYSKEYFDPFCRKKKVIFCHDTNFNTSIGQLNFFQWAIRNKVVKYVQLNLAKIEFDMKETTRLNREQKIIDSINGEADVLEPESEEELRDKYSGADPVICSSDCINNVFISSSKKPTKSQSKTDSERSLKRRQLSKSVYETGITKVSCPIMLDFD